jgi:glutamate formiminotransferase/formiminotetrahydrofolate cyclodeaminase
VGALAARSAVLGAYINVQINAAGLKDRTKADAILAEAKAIAEKAEKDEAEIMATVSRVINGDK